MSKLAIKTLTDSDLTLFAWQHRNRNAGNQKSINLNANIFIDVLYPYLPDTDAGRVGRIPVDLDIYGPGNEKSLNLQRKIIKGDSYKNWRLNGEVITNPPESSTRFDVLCAGDFAIFDFAGSLCPTGARIVLVAKGNSEDANLHRGLSDSAIGRMAAVEISRLRFIAIASGTPESHPVYELLLDSAIEDASLAGSTVRGNFSFGIPAARCPVPNCSGPDSVQMTW